MTRRTSKRRSSRHLRANAAVLATSEGMATAPIGTLLVSKDGIVAWRRVGPLKTDWLGQKPSAGSTADHWRAMDDAKVGSHTFVGILKFIRREDCYLLYPSAEIQKNPMTHRTSRKRTSPVRRTSFRRSSMEFRTPLDMVLKGYVARVTSADVRKSKRLRPNTAETAETGVLVTIPLPRHRQTARKYANNTSYPTVAKALAAIRSKLRKDTLGKIERVDAYVYPDAATSEYPSGWLRFEHYKVAGTYLWRMWGGPLRYENVFSVFGDEKLRPNAALKWSSPDVNIRRNASRERLVDYADVRADEIVPGMKLRLRRIARWPGALAELETVKTVDRVAPNEELRGDGGLRIHLKGVTLPGAKFLRPLHGIVDRGVLVTVQDKRVRYEVLGIVS